MGNYNYEYSLITISNHEDVYQEFRKGLLQQKNVDYELIKINNDQNQFNSARTAYNEAAAKATGKYLVFLHPDIRFLDEYSLRDTLNKIKDIGDFGVAGIAGSPWKLYRNRSFIVTAIVQGENKESVGTSISKTTEVQTVDESFFVMKKTYWEHIPFTDCPGWHFYAVEQCLRAVIDGKKNYVVPARIWHKSTGGSEDRNYVRIGKQIVKEYGNYFPYINTTVTKWDTKGIAKYTTPWYRYAKRQVHRYLDEHK
ncbi:glycosyltransferase family protein [Limosilactobacillus reuteri]|uniref:glycosyltransferase n=1 Tax=Limosilactobacillus reuteri TaxID=1598 RepID=UPI001E2AFCF7|nr:glycosyltransferase [Limosilactobacillus reuteri]MCC4322828.1 glycosyltransferase family protein [Limosilactobacillus reuteri]MCC4333217.1 glycosyltransferase family protein [Limosilactobacillus reuteri]MCC4436659.1 glycosyltransferase family protein [Limosilactobacillus reuteri]MCC4438814.1 glycosyltransferase family protein [Limosilactobacillus reuteri]MCC4442821.1 glycosyltransferase family protein [Limosilactobacillus reuteri]